MHHQSIGVGMSLVGESVIRVGIIIIIIIIIGSKIGNSQLRCVFLSLSLLLLLLLLLLLRLLSLLSMLSLLSLSVILGDSIQFIDKIFLWLCS